MSWLPILVVGVASLGLRSSFLVFGAGIRLTPRVQRALAVAAPALLAAVTAPELTAGPVRAGVLAARLAATAVAIVLAHRTEAIGRTVAAGFGTYAVLAWLL